MSLIERFGCKCVNVVPARAIAAAQYGRRWGILGGYIVLARSVAMFVGLYSRVKDRVARYFAALYLVVSSVLSPVLQLVVVFGLTSFTLCAVSSEVYASRRVGFNSLLGAGVYATVPVFIVFAALAGRNRNRSLDEYV